MFNIGKAEEIYYSSTMNIYPVNVARVESNISSGNYDLNNANNHAAQGLPTIDYLLYGVGESETEIIEKLNDTKYIDYLVDLSNQMTVNTSAVINDWETYKNEFFNSTDNTATSAVNMMVNDFIFYYEKGFRANKFGIPAGRFSSTPIPENVESYFSGTSKMLSIEAISAVKDFYTGKHPFNGTTYSGSSLKSVISELDENLGQNNLSSRISDKLDVAIQKINELDENYKNQTVNDIFDQEKINNILNITDKKCSTGKCKKFGCADFVWYNILKQFGKYAHNKLIPEWVQEAPIEFIQEFMNGYNKADGSISKEGKHKITTVSHNLAFGVQRLYLKLGHIFSINYTKRNSKHIIQGRTEMGVSQMDGLNELWELSWLDGFLFCICLMGLYTYKVWIDNKFKK